MASCKRILVAGGAGFLGSHLCARLLDRGDHVVCLDNFFTGTQDNITSLLASPRFEVVRHDITEPYHTSVDRIYNLACPASPVHYQLNPVQTIKTNVYGAIHLLELAKETGARIFQASTSEVYGDPEEHPQTERYWGRVNPVGRRSCYDEGKRCAEAAFFDYRRQYGLDIKVARIFNTYGPKMRPDDGRVVSTFICQALRGEDITIFGDGSQTRSFCYVTDLMDALVLLMETPDGVTGPVNLGNPVETTVLSIAETVLSLCGGSSRIRFLPLPEDDPRQRKPDITLARTLLGWEPRVPLGEGLKETIRWLRRTLP